MGDAWREDLPSNWPSVSDVEPRTPLSDADKQNVQMWQLVALCCARRHFFITKQGRFGLGPSEMISGELVCVLLGSDVPFLLQNFRGNEFRFVGQAYVRNNGLQKRIKAGY